MNVDEDLPGEGLVVEPGGLSIHRLVPVLVPFSSHLVGGRDGERISHGIVLQVAHFLRGLVLDLPISECFILFIFAAAFVDRVLLIGYIIYEILAVKTFLIVSIGHFIQSVLASST